VSPAVQKQNQGQKRACKGVLQETARTGRGAARHAWKENKPPKKRQCKRFKYTLFPGKGPGFNGNKGSQGRQSRFKKREGPSAGEKTLNVLK